MEQHIFYSLAYIVGASRNLLATASCSNDALLHIMPFHSDNIHQKYVLFFPSPHLISAATTSISNSVVERFLSI
jgi:hypothetical protein